MAIQAGTPDEYIRQLPEERKKAVQSLRETLLASLPKGFEETINHGMIGYVVPHTLYPKGYHTNPHLPLPFISLASQKNHIALYHYGLYANQDLMDWFVDEYKKQTGAKPDMGKSCLRFRDTTRLPLDLIGELAGRMTPQQWINLYEQKIKR